MNRMLFAAAAAALMWAGAADAAFAETQPAAPAVKFSRDDVESRVMNDLLAAPPKFDALEGYAVELRGLIAANKAGEDALAIFYERLGFMWTSNVGNAAIEQWRASRPQSPVPVLANLKGLQKATAGNLGAALQLMEDWRPGGNGQKELAAVREDLLRHKGTASADPYWYILMAETCVALKCDAAEVAALVEEGLARHPENFQLARVAANRFLSKWSGDTLEFEPWALRLADKIGGEDGDAIYARVYAQALSAQYGGALFDLTKPDWARLMSGVRALTSRRPNDAHLNEGALIACLGGARNLTRELLSRPDFGYYDFYWYQVGNGIRVYPKCRDWAGRSAAVETEPHEKPVPISEPAR